MNKKIIARSDTPESYNLSNTRQVVLAQTEGVITPQSRSWLNQMPMDSWRWSKQPSIMALGLCPQRGGRSPL